MLVPPAPQLEKLSRVAPDAPACRPTARRSAYAALLAVRCVTWANVRRLDGGASVRHIQLQLDVVPPGETRWRPGESGNPKGRPKGAATSLDRILEQKLDRLVEADASLGDEGRISRRRRLVRALLGAIERGDARAARPILDRIWPAPATREEPKPAIQIVVDARDLEA